MPCKNEPSLKYLIRVGLEKGSVDPAFTPISSGAVPLKSVEAIRGLSLGESLTREFQERTTIVEQPTNRVKLKPLTLIGSVKDSGQSLLEYGFWSEWFGKREEITANIEVYLTNRYFIPQVIFKYNGVTIKVLDTDDRSMRTVSPASYNVVLLPASVDFELVGGPYIAALNIIGDK
jgi:hypothetical protein